jgi:hypothetical protein
MRKKGKPQRPPPGALDGYSLQIVSYPLDYFQRPIDGGIDFQVDLCFLHFLTIPFPSQDMGCPLSG